MEPFKTWLKERDKQLYDEFALSDKLKSSLADLGKYTKGDGINSYGKGIGFGGLAGLAGTLAGGPLVGLPLGWLASYAVANRDYNDKNPVRNMKKKIKK